MLIKMQEDNNKFRDLLHKSEPIFYGSCNDKQELTEDNKSTSTRRSFTRSDWLTVIPLAFANFCSGSCVSLQAPFFPSEAESKGATSTQYGFIFGVFQLTMFLCAPIIGKIVPYVSPKYLLNIGITLVGLTCIFFGLIDLIEDSLTFITMAFLIRIVEGIGAATLKISCYTILASQFTDGLGKVYAVVETFLGLGFIIGPTVGGALYDFGGYGLPFYVVGSSAMIDALIVHFLLPHIPKSKMPEKGNLLKFWMHPRTLVYALSIFTGFNYIGFNGTNLEPHVRQFHLSGVLVGSIFALTGVVYAVSAPVWGWLCDKKFSSRTLSFIGCLIAVCSILIIGPAPFIPLNTSLELVLSACVLLGIALGSKLVCAFTGIMQETLNRDLPQDLTTQAMASSMVTSSQSLGAFVGPSLGGYLLDEFGYRKASMALLFLESVLILWLLFYIITSKTSKLNGKNEKTHLQNEISTIDKVSVNYCRRNSE